MSPHNEGIHCVLTTKVTFFSVCFSCETSVLLRRDIFRGDWNKQNSKCNVFPSGGWVKQDSQTSSAGKRWIQNMLWQDLDQTGSADQNSDMTGKNTYCHKQGVDQSRRLHVQSVTRTLTHTRLQYIPCTRLTTLPFSFSFSHFSLPFAALKKKLPTHVRMTTEGGTVHLKSLPTIRAVFRQGLLGTRPLPHSDWLLRFSKHGRGIASWDSNSASAKKRTRTGKKSSNTWGSNPNLQHFLFSSKQTDCLLL